MDKRDCLNVDLRLGERSPLILHGIPVSIVIENYAQESAESGECAPLADR